MPRFTVTFTDSQKTQMHGHWNFGDGSVSTDQNPTHTYSQVGNYNATLTAINEYGQDTKTRQITVKPPHRSQASRYAPTSGKNPLK